MQTSLKSKIPLIMLAVTCCSYLFFYLIPSPITNSGTYRPEWPLLIDGLILLPLICFLCIPDKKEATLKAVSYSILVILLGAYLIPAESKMIWNALEYARFFILAVFVVIEISAIYTVFIAIKASLTNQSDPDNAISNAVCKTFGSGITADVLMFESRVWMYLIFGKQIRTEQFDGDHHFLYDKKDGARSNLLGWISVIAMEAPIMHALLHFTWSPLGAGIVTLLTLISLVFFFGEYRAVAVRPISTDDSGITIRYGVFNSLFISKDDLIGVAPNKSFIRRSSAYKRYNYAGVPNVRIDLVDDRSIYVGVNEPGRFIAHIKALIETSI